MVFIAYVLGGIIAFFLLYLAADWILSSIAGNIKASGNKNISIYVKSNGVHTDLVFPVQQAHVDWKNTFPLANNKGPTKDFEYVAIGWGDKGFYLNTPEWKDLSLKTALVAGLGIGETALHVTYYSHIQEDSLCYQVKIDAEQYQQLVDYVEAALDRSSSNEAILIQTQAQYGLNDAFYEAKGAYSLFFSCNTWTNTALKKANLPSAYWTVFDTGILKHYR